MDASGMRLISSAGTALPPSTGARCGYVRNLPIPGSRGRVGRTDRNARKHTLEGREFSMTRMRRNIVTLLAAGTLSLGLAGPATAQIAVQDGLVNVAIGDISILNDARIGVAAQVA